MPEPREAPQNVDMEQSVLGLILERPEVYDRVSDRLVAEHFALEAHRRIFAVIADLIRADRAVAPATVAEHITEDASWNLATGSSARDYLANLRRRGMYGMSTVLLDDYVNRIVSSYVRRCLIAVGEDLVSDVYNADPFADPCTLIEAAELKLYALAERGQDRSTHISTIGEASRDAYDQIADARDRGTGLSGLSTGFHDIDQAIGGLRASNLVIIAARPGIGKTALALNIAMHVAKAGTPVAFFSLEMSDAELAMRAMAEGSRVSASRMARGRFSDDEFERIGQSVRGLQSIPLFIDKTSRIPVAQLTTRARRLKRQKGIGAIFVDYAQLMGWSGRRGTSEVQEITEITNSLKALAKDLEVPVIALSQLSREVEKRDDKRPMLSDLRSSGSIEQDADIVMFLYREEYYLRAREPAVGSEAMLDWQAKMDRASGRAELIIAKHRNGETRTVDLAFDGETTSFSDLREAEADRQMEVAF